MRSLVIVGTAAKACADTTIREAYMRDFDVVAPIDAAVAINPGWKRLAAKTSNHYFAAVDRHRDGACMLQPAPKGIA